MSVVQKIKELEAVVGPESVPLLEELREMVLPYDPSVQLKALTDAVLSKEPENDELLRDLVDKLHTSTASYLRPRPDRFNSFKKDLLRYFDYCHDFINKGMYRALFEYTLLYAKIFYEPKKICGVIRHNCHVKECDGVFKSIDQTTCNVCGEYRPLCRALPSPNGRCHRHGGSEISGALNAGKKSLGRVGLYEKSLNGELRGMYVEAVTDINYISVAPEIGALAARSGQLMSEIGDTDYLAVATGVQQAVRKMREAIDKEEYWQIKEEGEVIGGLLNGVVDDKRRWDEIAALSGRLGRLAETERKRLIEEQKMITVQEMYMIQQETLANIRDAASVVAASLVKAIRNDREIKQSKIRHLFLTSLHASMKGELNTDYYLADSEKEPVIVDQDD